MGEECEERVKIARVLFVVSSPDCSSVTNDQSNQTTQSYFHVTLCGDLGQSSCDISGSRRVSDLTLSLARRLGVFQNTLGHSQ